MSNKILPHNVKLDVEKILENLDQYAIDLLIEHGAYEGEKVFDFFPGGPIWPECSFDEALDDLQLCALVDYYPEGDIYYTPIRDELIRRICNDPVSLLNELGLCHEEIQNAVWQVVAGVDVMNNLQPEDLTDEGRKAYEKLDAFFGEET